MKLNILHEDNDIIVAVKPCGVPTQPDKTNSESMVSMLKLRIYEKENRKRGAISCAYTQTGQACRRSYGICQDS